MDDNLFGRKQRLYLYEDQKLVYLFNHYAYKNKEVFYILKIDSLNKYLVIFLQLRSSLFCAQKA